MHHRLTVRYRLLIQPELGAGLGNTVFVGLDVEDAEQLAPLVFEGLPRRVEQIREALDHAQTHHGMGFDTHLNTTATLLASAMASARMQLFAPELVAGAEILAREGITAV